MLWRQNLKRDLAGTKDKEVHLLWERSISKSVPHAPDLATARVIQERERQVRAAYIDAEALVKSCLNASHRAWNDLARQQLRAGRRLGGAPPRRVPSARGQMSLSDAPLGGARMPCLIWLVMTTPLGIGMQEHHHPRMQPGTSGALHARAPHLHAAYE
jgi:hypothetical protein